MPLRRMRPLATLALGSAAVLFACSDHHPTESTAPAEPSGPLPDLIVDQDAIATSWLVQTEEFTPESCDAIEGQFPPGVHRTLRFTVKTANVGDADIYLGDPLQHIDPNGDGDYGDSDGLFEYAPCHHHFHLLRYATYELLPVRADGSLGAPTQGRKAGFCLADDQPVGDTPP